MNNGRQRLLHPPNGRVQATTSRLSRYLQPIPTARLGKLRMSESQKTVTAKVLLMGVATLHMN